MVDRKCNKGQWRTKKIAGLKIQGMTIADESAGDDNAGRDNVGQTRLRIFWRVTIG